MKAFEKDQTLSWDDALKRMLAKKLTDKKKRMREMVLGKLKDAIEKLDLE
jgi:hypothetical protein